MTSTTTPPPAAPAAPIAERRRRAPRQLRRQRSDLVAGPLMALPAMAGIVLFIAVPFVAAIGLSFFNVQLGSPRPPTFVGFSQYVRLFTDPVEAPQFLRALGNNLFFAVVVIPLQTGLALVFAVLLNQQLKGIRFFRTFFFMPVVFPMALVAVIWRVILDRSGGGLLNSAVETFTGGAVGPHDWLGSGATAMLSVIALSIWQGVGFQMVIILAALQEIPEERYEAARLDRANRFQQFVHITVPGVRNTLIFVVLLTTIFAFRVYDQVYILITTAGGNENALRTVLYQATNAIITENSVGRATAISVVLFVIIVVVALVQRAVLRQRSES
ncbi:carbohydrate ABC transporter permease [Curtobacterium citreum]|uniref:carbohydrate ABC transporter permease n=1 Tax=Curtobacterium citreum TaxID=2036 RepID=UPI000736DF4C|nr:sugar ABC transporter permease [Curtobacterium citreum]KTR19824.1 ABC transporter permease [Curtobacterium citreum]